MATASRLKARVSKTRGGGLQLAHAKKKAISKRRPSGNRAGRPTASELERRKSVVMEVATELFIKHGYAATSLVDIAKGAGVATRTLYQHFGDKEALFREVILARDIGATVPLPKIEDGDTLRDILVRIAYFAHEVTFRPRYADLMRLMIAESARFPDFMQQVGMKVFSKFQGNVRRLFEQMEELKLIPGGGDHARQSTLFLDIIQGSAPIMNYTRWSTNRPSAKYIEERVEFFIQGAFGPAVARVASTRTVRARQAD